MKIYTVYAKQDSPNPLETLLLVKEGFSWQAAILHFFWALYKKMWLVSVVVLVINIFLIFLELKGYIQPGIIFSIKVGLLLFIGYNFNDWQIYNLRKNGYSFCGVVSGKNEDEASYKFINQCCSAPPLFLAKPSEA